MIASASHQPAGRARRPVAEGGALAGMDEAPGVVVRGLSILAMLPFRARRLALRALFGVMDLFGLVSIEAADVERIASLLHAPRKAARRIARQNAFVTSLFHLEAFALSRRPVRGLVADCAHVATDGDALLRWAAGQPAIIIGGLHTGAYPSALAWMLRRYFSGRRITILRSKPPGVEEERAMARLAQIGVEVRLLYVGARDSAVEILREQRRGGVFVMLLDLPGSYGRPAAVEILWRRASIAAGIADVSALCRCPFLLFRVESGLRRDLIHVEAVREVPKADEGSRAAVAAVIARFLTRALLEAPAQWLFWCRAGEFFGKARR